MCGEGSGTSFSESATAGALGTWVGAGPGQQPWREMGMLLAWQEARGAGGFRAAPQLGATGCWVRQQPPQNLLV